MDLAVSARSFGTACTEVHDFKILVFKSKKFYACIYVNYFLPFLDSYGQGLCPEPHKGIIKASPQTLQRGSYYYLRPTAETWGQQVRRLWGCGPSSYDCVVIRLSVGLIIVITWVLVR